MASSAETLFDYLGERYQTAFSSSPYLRSTIRTAIEQLPLNSDVLDVGCGNPTSCMLAAAGHNVHGIDASGEMVKIASRQVPSGNFEKADMRTFTPPEGRRFDAVFPILSLYQLTPGELYSLCFKSAEWVKPGGIVVFGVTSSTALGTGNGAYDPTCDCERYQGKPFMDTVEAETFYDFVPEDEKHKTPERDHFFITRREVDGEPFLGPYPLPNPAEKDVAPIASVSGGVTDRLGKVLYFGSTKDENSSKADNIDLYKGPLETLPFPSESFPITFVPWQLDSIADTPKALAEIHRVTNRAPGSQIVFTQGAPDNESGLLLRSTMEHMANHGSGVFSVRRIHARYEFPDGDVESKSEAAATLLMRLYGGDAGAQFEEIKDDLRPRLRLHFKGWDLGYWEQHGLAWG
ncbi:S-adenosyl-L-methionine-dependent methyltransferase [Aspergillus undulatus]|uniref:S-adenosyl-L-methionine-dependent methyltransferase n=1 Tax=Aspergillus undulatus TaxID=1810928 RepID=UPI003CCCDFAB